MLFPESYLGVFVDESAAEAYVLAKGWVLEIGMYFNDTGASGIKWYNGSGWTQLT